MAYHCLLEGQTHPPVVQVLLGSEPVHLSPTFISPTAQQSRLCSSLITHSPSSNPPSTGKFSLPYLQKPLKNYPNAIILLKPSFNNPSAGSHLSLPSPWCRLSPLRLYVGCFGPISSSCWFAINVVFCESPATDAGLAPVNVQWGAMERVSGQAPVIEAASILLKKGKCPVM